MDSTDHANASEPNPATQAVPSAPPPTADINDAVVLALFLDHCDTYDAVLHALGPFASIDVIMYLAGLK